jgi:hypothetical protein
MAEKVLLVVATFRALFPEFASVEAYPDEALQIRWDAEAVAYVSDENCGDLRDAKRAYAIQLMLAHLLRLSKLAAAEGTDGPAVAGVVTGATIDKISVTLAPPPTRDAWGYWLAQTSYGGQLSAFLSRQAVGGFYIGGMPERAGFRKVGGVF